MTPQLTFRDAARSDSDYIAWLEEACMKDHAVALWGVWRPSAKPGAFDVAAHQIVELAGQDIGCVAIREMGEFMDLKRLFIAPEFQNRGYGKQVLDQVVRSAQAAGLTVRLSVLTTNPALRFYLREGFSVISETSERRILVKTGRKAPPTNPLP